MIAVRRPEASLAAVNEEMRSWAGAIANESREDPGLHLNALPLHDRLTADVLPVLLFLFGAVGFVLLIAVVNVSHLMLERTLYRAHEIALRVALGASRTRVARLLLATLTLAGGVAGLLVAFALVRLATRAAPEELVRFGALTIDARVLAFAALLSIAAGVIAAIAPIARANRSQPSNALGRAGRAQTVARAPALVRVLAGGEVALALPLLVGGMLLIASLIKLQAVAPGFNPANVLTVDLFMATPNSTEPTATRARNLIEPALQRIRALPGVVAAGVVSVLPVSAGPSTDFAVEGRDRAADAPSADVVIADAGYFGALEIPLRRGRLLRDDDSPGRPRAIVVSEAFVRRYSPNDDLLGRRTTMLDWGPPITAEIVGVVGFLPRSTCSWCGLGATPPISRRP